MLLRVAYLGAPFHGLARQPDLRTVEGDLSVALDACFGTGSSIGLTFSSRTDKGVAALANIAILPTDLDPRIIPTALNPRLSGIWITATAQVTTDLHVRHAASRTYRYHLPRLPAEGPDRIRDLLPHFLGEHDLSRFHRPEAHRDPVRTMTTIELVGHDAGHILRITAPNFLWQQVRRIAGACMDVATGKVSTTTVCAALRLEGDYEPAPAPPERLVLEEVDHPGAEWLPVTLDDHDPRLTRWRIDAEVRASITARLTSKG